MTPSLFLPDVLGAAEERGLPIAIVGIGCGWPGGITNPDGLSKPLLSY
jgi:hypothetical protein